MSYDLVHSRGYIYIISSGKSLTPLSELFAICDYFCITPAEFFDDSVSSPKLIQNTVEGMKQLDDVDQLMILNYINSLLKNSMMANIIYGKSTLTTVLNFIEKGR